MLKTKKPLIAAVSMALGLGIAGSVQSAPALISTPDGVKEVTFFDWNQTSFLAQGGNTAIANFVGSGGTCPDNSCNFSVLTQARLGSAQNGGAPVSLPGLNVTYEITLVTKFTERVTAVGPGASAQFATVATPTTVLIYFDVIGDATGSTSNPLTGHGFNDGRLVLKGEVLADSVGFFVITGQTAAPLDQSPTPTPANDNYPGQLTLPGIGTQASINVGNLTQDFTFFLNQLSGFGLNFTNISQQTPFINVDPMECFTNSFLNTAVGTSNAAYACDNVHAAGPYSVQTDGFADAHGYIPAPGVINGLLQSGADFVAQTDYNSGIDAVTVPEPASLALVGLGLGLLGFGARRRLSR